MVGRALLDMLAETLDRGFTPEVREAWTALYGAVESLMKLGAAEADLPVEA
jgi:hemoglobin-like flavoprotein